MSEPIAFYIGLAGWALVAAWLWRNPDAFENLTSALSSTVVQNTRTLQSRT